MVISRASDCIFCKDCIYALEEFRKSPEDPLAVEIKHSTNKFSFTVETTGALHAKEVVRDALQVLAYKINTMQKAIPLLVGGNDIPIGNGNSGR